MPSPNLADDILFVGHSLVGGTIPAMLEDVVRRSGGDGDIVAQVINGASLKWNWQHSANATGADARAELPRGDFEVLVLTEALPLDTSLAWSDSAAYAKRFYDLAVFANPTARVFLYETWHDLRSGTGVDIPNDDGDDVPWRERLDADLSKWESIVDEVNARRGSGAPEMLLVPAGQAMARLHDEIEAGRVPDVSRIDDLFKDNIHLNQLGSFFVAMVHFAAIYEKSPISLPHELSNRYGVPYDVMSAELAAKLQSVAWEAVASYPRSGAYLPPKPPAPVDEDGDDGHAPDNDDVDREASEQEDVLIVGTRGSDVLFGGADDERIWGKAGDDTLKAGEGDDRAGGGAGSDRVFGQGGNDDLFGGAGRDLLHGGTGRDFLRGGVGSDRSLGGAGADLAFGAKGDDRMNGGGGSDIMAGGGGDDRVRGGKGADLLNGGRGDDVLTGGRGSDVFEFSGRRFGKDVITDYGRGGDVLDFSRTEARSIEDLGFREGPIGLALSIGRSELLLKGVAYGDIDPDDLIF